MSLAIVWLRRDLRLADNPALAAAEAGKRVLLANKEALVMAGHLFMAAVRASGAVLLPIDSEHNAILQCMPDNYATGHAPGGVFQAIGNVDDGQGVLWRFFFHGEIHALFLSDGVAVQEVLNGRGDGPGFVF